MNKAVVNATVKVEIEDAKQYGESYGWQFSEINEDAQSFTVLLQSPISTPVAQEKFLIEFVYDDYPEKPYLIDLLHPDTKARKQKVCLPHYDDSFFNPTALVICHPCNRGAYSGYTGLHKEWNFSAWRSLAGGQNSLKWILDAMYTRISDPTKYHGRLK